MDARTRQLLAAIMGGGGGYAASLLFGNLLFFVVLGVAIAIAAETGLRTPRNVKIPPPPEVPRANSSYSAGKRAIYSKKPPKPKF